MGARNVIACFTTWSHLDHAPFRLLVGMAVQALDDTSDKGRPPRVWFGGEDALTELVGRSPRQAYRALKTLREVGAIESVDTGRNGHRAVYNLHLDAVDTQPSLTLDDRLKPDAERHDSLTLSGRSSLTLSDTPRNHEGTTKESRQGEQPVDSTTSLEPVDNDDDLSDAARTEQHHRQLIATLGLPAALRIINRGHAS